MNYFTTRFRLFLASLNRTKLGLKLPFLNRICDGFERLNRTKLGLKSSCHTDKYHYRIRS